MRSRRAASLDRRRALCAAAASARCAARSCALRVSRAARARRPRPRRRWTRSRSATGRRVDASRGRRDQAGAQVVAERVEAVDRRDLEEDVVHQALDAAGLVEAREQRGRGSSRPGSASSPKSAQVLEQRLGVAAAPGRRPRAASPRLSSDGTDWRENGPSARMKRFRSGAASPRSAITGVISSESAPRSSIVGLSSRRKRGSCSNVRRARRAARPWPARSRSPGR